MASSGDSDEQRRFRETILEMLRGGAPPPDRSDARNREILELLRRNPLVYGGRLAEGARYHSCVAFLLDGKVFGSGVLLGKRTILTAAHVLTFSIENGAGFRPRDRLQDVQAYTAPAPNASASTALEVDGASLRVHAGYDPRSASTIRGAHPKYDAALISLKQDSSMTPAHHAATRPRAWSILEVCGFGATQLEDGGSDRIGKRMVAEIVLRDCDLAAAEKEDFGYCPPQEFTLGSRLHAERPQTPDTRRGDSGGPVFDSSGELVATTCRGVPTPSLNCGVYLWTDSIREWLTENVS